MNRQRFLQIVGFLIVQLGLLAAILHAMGRSFWCNCGHPNPWTGDIWSSHCSQHCFDPYSLTHVLHGVAFYFLLWAVLGKTCEIWQRGLVAGLLESGWEIFENSSFTIERFRSQTISLNYYGDSVGNSLCDVLCCLSGYSLASILPPLASLAFFCICELTLLLTIRDSLLINIWMLIWPSQFVQEWQKQGRP